MLPSSSSSRLLSSLPWLLTCWPSLPAGCCCFPSPRSFLSPPPSTPPTTSPHYHHGAAAVLSSPTSAPLRCTLGCYRHDAVPALHLRMGLSRSAARTAGGSRRVSVLHRARAPPTRQVGGLDGPWRMSVRGRAGAAPSRQAGGRAGLLCASARGQAGAPPSREAGSRGTT